MRFRAGIVTGFGIGYYLGAAAGKERHQQINRLLKKVRRSEAFDVATDKAKAVVDLGVERAKDAVEHKLGNGHDEAEHTVSSSAMTTGLRTGVENN